MFVCVWAVNELRCGKLITKITGDIDISNFLSCFVFFRLFLFFFLVFIISMCVFADNVQQLALFCFVCH